MTDRRRKRNPTSSFGEDTVKDFNTVLPAQARRRSDWSESDGGPRHESWMAKVSTAMSTRIFSGSKKLSGSRSTQVMPLGVSVSDTSKTSVGRMSSSSLSSDTTHQSSTTTQPALRQAASEKTLMKMTTDSSPVMMLGPCPSVTCDVASDDSDCSSHDEHEAHRSSRDYGSSRRRAASKRNSSHTVAHKVKPGEDEQESDEDVDSTSPRMVSLPSHSTYSRETREDNDSETNVQDAAPILKGFFTRDASIGKEIREQQREQRREALYRESKRRQDRLREETERDRVASEEASRKYKVEQLRRLNQQRRLNLLRDAADARVHLLERIQEDKNAYESERERWESDFEDEMTVLSAAFRKARTSEPNRPMTVAGLAVPEAMSQLERDASNFEKRVKTAQPALASGSSHQRQVERPSTTSGPGEFSSAVSFFESCQVLALEDSKEVLDLFPTEDTSSSVSEVADNDTEKLLQEREDLLQRLAAIDRIVQTQL